MNSCLQWAAPILYIRQGIGEINSEGDFTCSVTIFAGWKSYKPGSVRARRLRRKKKFNGRPFPLDRYGRLRTIWFLASPQNKADCSINGQISQLLEGPVARWTQFGIALRAHNGNEAPGLAPFVI